MGMWMAGKKELNVSKDANKKKLELGCKSNWIWVANTKNMKKGRLAQVIMVPLLTKRYCRMRGIFK